MKRLLRYIIIPAATAAAVVGIGAFLNTRSPFVDAITGATSKVEAGETPVLEGKYIFVVNTATGAFTDDVFRANVMKAVQTNGEDAAFTRGEAFSLAVSEDDKALCEYAEGLAKKLEEAGVRVNVRKYSKTVLRSRIPVGKFEAFISTRGFTDAEAVKNSEYIMLEAEGMHL